MNLKILVLISSLIITGCSTSKLIGTYQPKLQKRSCPVTSDFCGFSNKRAEMEYKVTDLGGGSYAVAGDFTLYSSQLNNIYSSIRDMKLPFIFFQDEVVVFEHVFYIHGNFDESIYFNEILKIGVDIDSSLTRGWQGTITSAPF